MSLNVRRVRLATIVVCAVTVGSVGCGEAHPEDPAAYEAPLESESEDVEVERHDSSHGASHAPHGGDSTGTHGSHGPTAAGPAAAGPFVDRASALPTGEAGIDHEAIGPSTEHPDRHDGVGAFRTVCDFSHMNFDDPIVFPGQPGKAHLHAYFGNVAADAMSTPESLRDSGPSTCRGGTANRTAYWVPAVIDDRGQPVEPESLDVYYKSGYNGVAPSEVEPFPSGLRMIAGDAKSQSTQSVAYWGCRENYIGHPGSIPSCPSGDEIVMTVEFPQCWDGENLDSEDHKSHMAYPRDGGCPDTHPIAIPAITMNVVYANPGGGAPPWRLASDMYDPSLPPGYSAHADWFEAWDPEVVEAFVANCINPGLDCKSHLLGDGRSIH